MKCPRCNNEFPKHLIVDAIINNNVVTMCSLCYAELYKKLHGIDFKPLSDIAKKHFKEAKKLYPGWRP